MQHGLELPTPADLDAATVIPERVYITEADSAQQEVLEAIARGLSIVVQGPPGTGKSQTIVNMIAQALFDGRSVLFVAEKKVALDVVFDRLAQRGLADALLAVQRDADKSRFAKTLALRHAELVSSESDRGRVQAGSLGARRAGRLSARASRPAGAGRDDAFDLYGRHAAHIAETPIVRLERVERLDRERLERLGETLERLASQPSWLRRPDQAVWVSLRPQIVDLGRLHAARDQMADGQQLAIALAAIVAESEQLIGPQGDMDDAGLDRLTVWLQLIADAPVVPAHWVHEDPQFAARELERYTEERGVYYRDRASLLARYHDEVFESDIDRLAERFLGEYERFWKRWFNKGYATDVREVLGQRLNDHRKAVYAEIRSELDILRTTNARKSAWDASDHNLRLAFGALFHGVGTEPAELESALAWFRRFVVARGQEPVDPRLSATLRSDDLATRARAAGILDRLVAVRSGLAACDECLHELFHDVPTDRRRWAPYLGAFIDAMEEVPRYLQYRKWIAELRDTGCGKLLDAIAADERIAPDRWRALFDRVVDASLIDYVHRTRSALAAFDREAHELVRDRYAAADEANVAGGGRAS